MRSDRRPPVDSELPSIAASLLQAWATSAAATSYLIDHLPAPLLQAPVPGAPRRTVGMIAGHIHNARCMWIRTLGAPHGVEVPVPVDRRRVGRAELVRALKRSGRGIGKLLVFGLEHGGRIPPTARYVWRNLPLDVGHVLAYFAAHEGHHRGQIVLLARQLGHRLPVSVTGGLWQWTKLSKQRG